MAASGRHSPDAIKPSPEPQLSFQVFSHRKAFPVGRVAIASRLPGVNIASLPRRVDSA
jgi:hypothetical protein